MYLLYTIHVRYVSGVGSGRAGVTPIPEINAFGSYNVIIFKKYSSFALQKKIKPVVAEGYNMCMKSNI